MLKKIMVDWCLYLIVGSIGLAFTFLLIRTEAATMQKRQRIELVTVEDGGHKYRIAIFKDPSVGYETPILLREN